MNSLSTTALFFCSLLATTFTCKATDPCPSAKSNDSDFSIIHVYGKCSPFKPPKPGKWVDTVMDMASKDSDRLKYLSSLRAQKVSAPIAPGQELLNVGNYVVRIKIGTPGQVMFMVLDTSSDLAWVPCSGCTGCSSTVFLPNTSTTYGQFDCSAEQCKRALGHPCPPAGASACLFNQTYSDSSFNAALSHDTLDLTTDALTGFTFGCINAISGKSVPPQGLIGLGRGPMSLLSQFGAHYSGVFSYCLPSFKSHFFSGSLILGPVGQRKNIRTTPLLHNPHRPSLYYVNLTGVSVGRVLVPIDPELLAFNPNTGAGTIIDSGTVITRFVQPVYNAIRDEFRKKVRGPFSSLGAFDTCFNATKEGTTPVVTLHFTGLDLKLPVENTLIRRSSGSVVCLAMAEAPSNVNSVLNVIANLQQQNLRIKFDVANSRVGIAREVCTKS